MLLKKNSIEEIGKIFKRGSVDYSEIHRYLNARSAHDLIKKLKLLVSLDPGACHALFWDQYKKEDFNRAEADFFQCLLDSDGVLKHSVIVERLPSPQKASTVGGDMVARGLVSKLRLKDNSVIYVIDLNLVKKYKGEIV